MHFSPKAEKGVERSSGYQAYGELHLEHFQEKSVYLIGANSFAPTQEALSPWVHATYAEPPDGKGKAKTL